MYTRSVYVTRETRTCSCQFQPVKEEETSVQLIKQKGRVRGGGLENAANEGNGLATLPFGLLSPYQPEK